MKRELLRLPSDEDALMLAGILQLPEGEIRGIVHLVHGMCEHKERYQHVLDLLSDNGYAAVIFDLRGHGESIRHPKDLGYFYDDSGVWIINDIHQVVHCMKKRFGDLPYIIFGHSMGSLAVRCYLRRFDYEVDGAVICGSPSANPLVMPAMALCGLLRKIKGEYDRSPLLYRLVMGGYERAFAKEGKSAWLCSRSEVVQAYEQDPLCGFPFTLNGYQNLFRLLYDTYDSDGWLCRKPSLPLLYIAGREDPCIRSVHAWKKAIALMRNVGYTNIVQKLYPAARHELHNEACREQVLTDLLQWIDSITMRICA